MTNPVLQLRELSVSYKDHLAVDRVSLALADGQIAALIGPSGCGKTSLLRAIAGFEVPSAGELYLDGALVASPKRAIAPEVRRVGMVFQDFALFPHMTVAQNIRFGLHGWSRVEADERVERLATLVGLAHYLERLPHQLSGGQQQRVAIARALAPRPQILMLDEPFSGLDERLRTALASDLRGIVRTENTTALMVTHDQHEAFAMADLVGVMRNGTLVQWDKAYNLYHQPADQFVADFIGEGVMIQAQLSAPDCLQTTLGALRGIIITRGGLAATTELPIGSSVQLLLRPDDVLHDDKSAVKLEVIGRSFRGADYLYSLRAASGEKILCLVQSHHNHAIGEYIGIVPDVEHLLVFPA